jgi:DNA helicase HerA-like ATPase
MKRNDRSRHHYCIGKSGTGKSVLLQTLARQDIWNGDGICLIDPHGDLAEDILAYIPKERAKDIVYFDAGNEDRPMGLNLYEINNLDEADKVVNDATEIFLKMFGPEVFGPRLQEYFKYGSLTLLEDFEDRPTLLDVVRLFTDEAYREIKLKKVTNPVVKNRREKTFNAMGDREKQEIIPYFSAKFVSFNTNRIMRNIIGQTKSGFNFNDIMNNRKILIINLSKGRIGELNAELLGMILVSKIYNGAMERAKIPESERKDFYLYVDEFQNFISGTFADILSEARKYKLSLIMAHQYIAQLE